MKWQWISSVGLLFFTGHPAVVQGQQPNEPHWVATFTTAQPLQRMPPRVPPTGAQPGPARAGSAVQQVLNTRGFHDQTARMIVRTSVGGSKARIRLSNTFGGTPVTVGAAHIALRGRDSEIVPESDRPLTFNGKPACTIGPGIVLLSDPVDFNVPRDADVAVSLYFPGDTGPVVSHNGLHTTYISKAGDASGGPSIPEATTTGAYYWLEAIDVLAPASTSLVVALGDSITESFRSTPDTNRSWPAVFSARLLANRATANVAVANMGIGGNRLLRDGTGASALARFDRDVLSQPGAKWVIVLEGINDIGRGETVPGEGVTAEELIGADRQIIERAHAAGLKAVGCTLPPFEGANYYREHGEAIREALNNWIRTSGQWDAVVDFEKATQDPADPKKLRAEFDPGDHLHLSDAGYKAMGDAIDLSIFTAKKK
jgi:lysophospholipase L1-like esterase